jgi:hypothetical protein
LRSNLKAAGKPEHPLGCIASFTERQAALKGQSGRYERGFVLFLAKSLCRLIGQRPLCLCFL